MRIILSTLQDIIDLISEEGYDIVTLESKNDVLIIKPDLGNGHTYHVPCHNGDLTIRARIRDLRDTVNPDPVKRHRKEITYKEMRSRSLGEVTITASNTHWHIDSPHITAHFPLVSNFDQVRTEDQNERPEET